jgi:hypothetical protein
MPPYQDAPDVMQRRVREAIDRKFESDGWVNSPYRNPEYAVSRYRIHKTIARTVGYHWETGEPIIRTYHRHPIVTADAIWEMLRRRKEREAEDPYAAWDYVTCTLSEVELAAVAGRLETLDNQTGKWD